MCNYADPFGLKVDLSGLTHSQRQVVLAMYFWSKAFRAMYDAVEAQNYTVYVRAPRDATDAVVTQAFGGGRYDHSTKTMVFSRPEDPRHPADQAEFESLVAHEFAHAAAGLPGGTPAACARDDAAQCPVTEQNKVHPQIGLRERRDYGDTGPFKPATGPTKPPPSKRP